MESGLDSASSRPQHKWIVLIAASLGLFLGSLDVTVNVALPAIAGGFAMDAQAVQWIIIFYVGSTTGLQLSLGSAADIYGLKRFYIYGLVIYSLAVLLIGLAPTFPAVLGLRVLQALGVGLIMASAPALVTRAFPIQEIGKGLGLMGGIAMLGGIAGTLGGGVLVDSFGWRAIFVARVPMGVLAIALAVVALKEHPSSEARASFDLRGAITLFVGLASMILGLTLGGKSGWTTLPVLILALVSIAALVLFVQMERDARRPVLDLALLRHRVLAPVLVSAYLMFLAIFVNWYILPFYLSDVLAVNAKAMGFLLALTLVVGALAAPAGGWLSDRTSPAYLATAALLIASGTMFWFSLLDAASTLTDVALRMVATGLGMGVFQASNASMIMGSVPRDRLGTGGAILSLSRSIGTVSSVAVVGAIFAARVDSHTIALAAQGFSMDPAGTEAFVLAFKDTYRLSAVLSAAAVLVSLTCWPQLLRIRRP
jgi:EmrB/QacA subfamily drug resistance transporter